MEPSSPSQPNPAGEPPGSEKAARAELELRKLELECQVLRAELKKATARDGFLDSIARHATLLTMVGGIVAFTVSIRQYNQQQEANREAARISRESEQIARSLAAQQEQESRDKDFMKPLWEKQIELYFEASTVAATIATTNDPAVRATAEQRFWVLYEGPLCVVEPPAVTSAMVAFGAALETRDDAELNKLSKALASAFQEAITAGSNTRLINFKDGKFDYRK